MTEPPWKLESEPIENQEVALDSGDWLLRKEQADCVDFIESVEPMLWADESSEKITAVNKIFRARVGETEMLVPLHEEPCYLQPQPVWPAVSPIVYMDGS